MRSTIVHPDPETGTGTQLASGLSFAVAALVLIMSGCGWGGDLRPTATVAHEIELTSEQPALAVEFEASLDCLRYCDGINVYLSWVRPKGSEASGVETHREVWDGTAWVDGWSSEITQVGLHSFRFRWTYRLVDDLDSTAVPIEAQLYTYWSDGSDEPPPDESILSDMQLSVASASPLD